MDYVIGIDVGTGSTKALGIDSKGNVHSSAHASYTTYQPQPDRSEQDPEAIWAAVVQCIRRITKDLNSSPKAISFSTAMHSLIGIGAGDKPITPMITWADNRASSIAEALYTTPKGKEFYRDNGTPIHAMTPLCKIKWFQENEPELFGRITRFVSIKEYIWYKVFGIWEVDFSIASATGLMDILKLSWNKEALNWCGITTEQLSDIRPADFSRQTSSSRVHDGFGTDANTQYYLGGSDGCMANIGSFAITHGKAALTIGTSGAVRVASPKPIINDKAMTFNYRLDDNTFICGGPTNNGGGVLRWYAEKMLGKDLSSSADYHDILDDVVSISPGSDGLIFLPYIFGERAPLWNSEACGTFFGIRSTHTQPHFTRAVIEGISMALHGIAELMENNGLAIDEVHVSGGFVHSPEWLQVLADVFGKKICLVHTSDASALGAAYLALKSSGYIGDYTELKSKGGRDILPNSSNHEAYKAHQLKFNQLLESLLPFMN